MMSDERFIELTRAPYDIDGPPCGLLNAFTRGSSVNEAGAGRDRDVPGRRASIGEQGRHSCHPDRGLR